MQETEQSGASSTGDGKTRRSRPRRILRFFMYLSALLALGIAGVIYFGVDRRLPVPDWARDHIAQRIEVNLPGLGLEFGEMEFVVNHGWRPRVRLRDVVLSDADGQILGQLNEAEAALAMRPLLRGQVLPKKISLFGAIGSLQRQAGGAVALSVDGGDTPVEQAETIVQMVEQWDQVFQLPNLTALTEVEMDALTLRYEDLGKGRAWTLDGGSIRLERSGDQLRVSSVFSVLSGRDYASSIELTYASEIGNAEAEISAVITEIPSADIAVQDVSVAWLGVLDAPISGAVRGRVDSSGVVGPVSATLQIGTGVLRPDDAAVPIPFNSASTYFTYHPGNQELVFDEIRLDSGFGQGVASGRAFLNTEGGFLRDLVAQVQLSSLRTTAGGLFDTPLELRGGMADFKLELAPFRFTLGEAVLQHETVDLRLNGALSVSGQDWVYAIDAGLDQIDVKDVVPLWPPRLAHKPRKWVQENFQKGVLSEGWFALRSVPDGKPVMSAGFAYDDATIRFMKTQPPITDGSGYASFADYRFAVTATAGVVTGDEGGPIDITGTTFVIPDTRIKKEAPAEVSVNAVGSVTSAMSALNRPPLKVLEKTTLPVDLAEGRAHLTGEVRLRLKDKVLAEEVAFEFSGDITDVVSDVLVPGHTLQASTLRIEGDQSQFSLYGDGEVSGVPMSGEWGRLIGKGSPKDSEIKAGVKLTEQVLEVFNIGLPQGSVSGETPAEMSVRFEPEKPPVLVVTSSLEGVELSLPSLGWRKRSADAGELRLEAILGPTPRVEYLALSAPGLAARGTISLRPEGGLERARFDSVQLGSWFDGAADLIGRGAGAAPAVSVRSGVFDLRTAPFGTGQAGDSEGGGPVTANLDRVQVSDGITLTGFSGEFSTTGGFNGKFQGRLNGGTVVSGVLVPQAQGTAVRVQAQDAGAVFRDAGIISNARGGSFDMTLVPTGTPGSLRGDLEVRNTRVKDGPALGALLNAISVVGLIDELAGNGIQFLAVKSQFILDPDKVTFLRSSAEGPSIGISMDGTYDLNQDTLDMRGVVSPLYLFNAIGSVLTRPGEGLIGFNYRLTGSAENPGVSVNPLSGLTPGFLREVFRQPAPSDPTQPTVEKPAEEEKGHTTFKQPDNVEEYKPRFLRGEDR